MTKAPEPVEPANLKFLRLLVTSLTAIMIVGVLVVIALLVTRLRDTGPQLPAEITLPDGARATAFTQGQGWYAVVTDDNRLLVENVNMIKKHVKPNPNTGETGGIIDKESPIQQSNVMIFNPNTEKGDRVGIKILEDNRKVRYYKSNGEVIDA